MQEQAAGNRIIRTDLKQTEQKKAQPGRWVILTTVVVLRFFQGFYL